MAQRKNQVRTEREWVDLRAAVVLLRSKGMGQLDIATRLGLKQSQVSTLLNEAIEMRMINMDPQVLRKPCAKEVWKRAKVLADGGERKLHRVLHAWSEAQAAPDKVRCQADVIYSGSDQAKFYREAGEHFVQLLRLSNRIGILYGRTLWYMAESLRKSAGKKKPPLHDLRHADFVPLCGDPVHLMAGDATPASHSASHVAEELAQLAQPKTQDYGATLAGLHAYIGTHEPQVIVDYFQKMKAYVDIFGEPEDPTKPEKQRELGLVHSLDAIVTGVGAFSSEEHNRKIGGLMQERILQENSDDGKKAPPLTEERLREMVFGDIGGVLLPREKPPTCGDLTVDMMNERWLGLRGDHLRDCAKKGKPGVIVISRDPTRAEVIRAAVKEGMVSRLIISEVLSEALKALGD